MKTYQMKTYQQKISGTVNGAKFNQLDWGIQTVVQSELDALLIAYGYKGSKHGVEIRESADGLFIVTVFNEFAEKAGIGR